MPNLLPAALSNHYQFAGDFCAVSGFECIAKLHNLIQEKDFPLQSDTSNQYKGFGDTQFLNKWFLCTEGHLDTAGAMALIEKETNEGRHPLVSMFVKRSTKTEYHIFLLTNHGGDLLLIDPSSPTIVASGRVDVQKELEDHRANDPGRKTLHVFWYDLKPLPISPAGP
jgi:hypothetical protein